MANQPTIDAYKGLIVKRRSPRSPEEIARSKRVALKFTQPIEVYINGEEYKGTEVIAPDYTIASEIVRIAKGAYGDDILA